MKIQLRIPQIIPWDMEKVKGIRIIIKKAGMASSKFFQLIFLIGSIIKAPTITKTGAVETSGSMDKSGDKNIKGKKSKAVTSAVRPVLPPSCSPVEDSM